MPKSKMREGMRHLSEAETAAEKEALYRKNIREFELGTLSKVILERLSPHRQVEYYNKQYDRRYKRRIVWDSGVYSVCPHCLGAAYYDSGYVSDRHVRFLTGKHLDHSDDKEYLRESWPAVYTDLERLNPGIFD